VLSANYSKTRRIIFLQRHGKALSSTCCERVIAELFEKESYHTRFISETGCVRNDPNNLKKIIGKRGVSIVLIVEHSDGSCGVILIDNGDGRVPREFKKRLKDTRDNSYQILSCIAQEVREQELLAKC